MNTNQMNPEEILMKVKDYINDFNKFRNFRKDFIEKRYIFINIDRLILDDIIRMIQNQQIEMNDEKFQRILLTLKELIIFILINNFDNNQRLFISDLTFLIFNWKNNVGINNSELDKIIKILSLLVFDIFNFEALLSLIKMSSKILEDKIYEIKKNETPNILAQHLYEKFLKE